MNILMVHGISLPPGRFGGEAIERMFTNTLDPSVHPFFESLSELRVSAHFLIRRDGELVQFVPCDMRAWHAGLSMWAGRHRCNDGSIGVELEGSDEIPYGDVQYRCFARLAEAIRGRYPIADMIGHSDAAPGRKTDPGPLFDWGRVRAMLARRA